VLLQSIVGTMDAGLSCIHRRPRRAFIGFEALVCGDDAEAIEQAKRLVGACDVELWCGPRLVIRLIPPEEKADT
jgi:hypothetical protein